jgi:hypothetical protein
MVRWVPEEHGPGQAAGLRLLAVLGGQDGLEAVAAEAGIAQRRHAVVVTREDPEAERALVDRVALAHPLVERIRVGVEFRRERIEERLVGRHRAQLTIG